MTSLTLHFKEGLPPDGEEGQWLGWTADGRVAVLRWQSPDQWGDGFWATVSFENDERGYPRVVACRDDMAGFIVSHARIEFPPPERIEEGR